ncbi:hypothetical protein L3Q82_019477 [Scortum barcoo]|uniref:Uncharacterized protein n=1 Tax=Scortum barcoo TaxID=214431 RepID=A0ACB8VBK9_9TELE|nr:hypothetical protein L3Q82_019477 [Scortum barcoo]
MWSLLFTQCIALSCVTTTANLIHASGYEGREANVSCSYDEGYQSYEKYLCRGDCGNDDVLIKTTETKKSRYSIHDDKEKRVFTATISHLSRRDAGKYWCGVTRTGKDIYTEVKLEVGKDSCCDRSTKVQYHEEGSGSFSCPYEPNDQNDLKYICRGNQTYTCLQRAVITSGDAKKGKFRLTDDKTSKKFTVTITSLTQRDSGLYLCGVHKNSGLDVFSAVELEVKEWCCVKSKKQSGTVGLPVTLKCPYPQQHKDNRKFLCKGQHNRNCTDMTTSQSRFTLQDDVSLSSFSVMVTELKAEDAGTYWCGSDPQWGAGNYTKIQLSVVSPQQTTPAVISTNTLVLPPGSQSTQIPGKTYATMFYPVVIIVPVVLLILTSVLVMVYKYKCHKVQGAEVDKMDKNKTMAAAEEVVTDVADIYENQDVVEYSKRRTSKPQSTCNLYADEESDYQNFTITEDIYCNELGSPHSVTYMIIPLVPRPHYDSRAVAQAVPEKEPPVQTEVPQPSAGSATAGYRSAKYTPAEWFSNYHSILQQAGTDHHRALSIQRESRSLYQDTEAATLQTQAEGTRLLGERLQEIHCWRSELQRHVEQLRADTESLLALKKRLEKALDATETPYAIATDNLNCRTRRLGPDLVRDTVEEELMKEVDLIRCIQALLKRTTAQVVSQIKMNREAKQTLELDWSDKYQAYSFDDHSGRYSNVSPDTQHYPSSSAMQDQVCNCTSWTKFTQDNLSKAVQEEQSTNSLMVREFQLSQNKRCCVCVRLLVEQVLQDTTEDLRAQCSRVDRAFSQRCAELIEAKAQLEMKLAQILEHIGVQERNIVALQQAIHNKEAPLRVAQSRLYLRSLRPNMELCRDEPQLSLEGEVRQIDATLASLHQQLSEARGSLSRLEESRITLEKDINCKSHSLFIEREKCMTHRKRYPTVSTLSGY